MTRKRTYEQWVELHAYLIQRRWTRGSRQSVWARLADQLLDKWTEQDEAEEVETLTLRVEKLPVLVKVPEELQGRLWR